MIVTEIIVARVPVAHMWAYRKLGPPHGTTSRNFAEGAAHAASSIVMVCGQMEEADWKLLPSDVSQRVVFATQTYTRDGPGPQLRGSNCPARIYLFLHRPKKERAVSRIAFQQRKRISAASTTALSKRQIRSSAPPSYSSCTSQGPLHPG